MLPESGTLIMGRIFELIIVNKNKPNAVPIKGLANPTRIGAEEPLWSLSLYSSSRIKSATIKRCVTTCVRSHPTFSSLDGIGKSHLRILPR